MTGAKAPTIYNVISLHRQLSPPELEEQIFYCERKVALTNCCFTHTVGLPHNPASLKPSPLMPYQMDFYKKTITSTKRKFHVNKSRQMGFTEIVLRILQYECFHKYKNYRIMIIAGTREKTTKKIMARMYKLFASIKFTIEEHSDLIIQLRNGTVIEGLPASSDSIRGDTKIKAIFLDEAAHFNLVDDSVVMDAIMPIVRTNKSDLYLISTPRGRRGFFYNVDEGQPDKSFHKLKYPIWTAVGTIYTKQEARDMLKDPTVDGDQEYLCKYTTSRSSIFGDEFTEGEHEQEIY